MLSFNAFNKQIDELSKKTFGSYIGKATRDASFRAYASGLSDRHDEKGAKKLIDKSQQRQKNVAKAADRLSGRRQNPARDRYRSEPQEESKRKTK